MSIYASTWSVDADVHTDTCELWQLAPPGLPILGPLRYDNDGTVHYLDRNRACSCLCGPIVYQGSHVMPADDHHRGGLLDARRDPWIHHPRRQIPRWLRRRGRRTPVAMVTRHVARGRRRGLPRRGPRPRAGGHVAGLPQRLAQPHRHQRTRGGLVTGRELIERLQAFPDALDLEVLLLPCDGDVEGVCTTVDIDRFEVDGPTYLVLTDEEEN